MRKSTAANQLIEDYRLLIFETEAEIEILEDRLTDLRKSLRKSRKIRRKHKFNFTLIKILIKEIATVREKLETYNEYIEIIKIKKRKK